MAETELLVQFSSALAANAAVARARVAEIRLGDDRHRSATLWRHDLLVASAQALPEHDEYVVVLPGGVTAKARNAGRDSSTNIALLALAEPVAFSKPRHDEARAGALAHAYGADGAGSVTARLGLVNRVGPEWHSQRGGRIERRIVLDLHVGADEEGGPVFDSAGALLGISTLAPRGQVLVIPCATIERVIPPLLRDGRIARGWLGVALQRVAVPDALRATAGQASGYLVLSTADDGPAAKAGILGGDILVGIDGEAIHRRRGLSSRFGADSIGRIAELQLIRGGAVIAVQATIAARPAA